ncbi:YPDG domain-containing protein, partial [Arcanobacterium haemolyticum]|nr:YPDG domain-containing protein [Arcanobacterium haemolyticum]
MSYSVKSLSQTGKRLAALIASGAIVASGVSGVAMAAESAPSDPAAAAAPATSRPSVDDTNARVIEADAIANQYIRSGTDATNARAVLSGAAWVVDKGTPASFSNGLTAVPEGTPVYMQWIDTDGAVSPIYKTITHNDVDVNGDGDATGSYAFDLRTPWKDAAGKEHVYTAKGNQYYRLWIQDFTTEQGNTATMFRQAGGFFPGVFVGSATGSNLGQFPLLGTNMQKTGVYMYVEDSADYMTRPESEWIDGTYTGALTGNRALEGTVWLETGAGDRANSATGPNDNSADPQAVGYKVVFSSLTDEGAAAYKANVESLPTSQQADAARKLLTDHPEYISATIYTTTDDKGNYKISFPAGTYNHTHLYGYVMDPEGRVVEGYSSYTSPLFRTPNSNLSWAPQTAPVALVSSWANVNFALVASTQVNLDVTNYDVTDNPATNGDTAKLNVTGQTLSPLYNKIEWVDSNGKVLETCDNNGAGLTSLTEANACTFTVPDDVADQTVITARLVSGDNIVAADSFIVLKDSDKDGDPDATDPDANNDGTVDDTKKTADSQHLTQGVKIDGVAVNSNGDNNDNGAELPAALRNLVVTLTAKTDMTYKDSAGNDVTVPAGTTFTSGDASTWLGAKDFALVQNFGLSVFPKGEYSVAVSGITPGSGYAVDAATSDLVDGGTITIDGNTRNLFVNVTSPKDADENDPTYQPVSVTKGASVSSETPKNSDGSDLPSGSSFAIPDDFTAPTGTTVTIDPQTGVVTVETTDGTPAGDITVPVVVTYPDKSTDNTSATISVNDPAKTDAENNDPGYQDGSGAPGTSVEIDQTGDTTL